MPIQRGDIVLSVVLMFVTCGLYGFYWMYRLTNDVQKATGRSETASGGWVVLYTFLTCFFYRFYWLYKISGQVVKARLDKGLSEDAASNKSYMWVTVAAALFSLGIMVLSQLVQLILNILVEYSEYSSWNGISDESLGYMVVGYIAMTAIIMIIFGIWEIFVTGIILWLVYKRSDRSPMVLHVLMELLVTPFFTLAFVQYSLNDYLDKVAAETVDIADISLG